MVTTASLVHATPGAAYAHTPYRLWQADSDIPLKERACVDMARQMVEFNHDMQVLVDLKPL